MMDRDQWQQQNDAYLAAALEWLRLRLAGQLRRAPDPEGQPDAAAGSDPNHAAQVAEALAAMDPVDAEDPPPALSLLCQQLGLSPFEREVLLLCAAMELDPKVATLCAKITQQPYPTFALALSLFEDPAWDVLSPQRPLRYWRLLEINQPGAQPLTTSPLRADERIVNYIKGLNYLDDRLVPLLTPIPIPDGTTPLPPSQQAAVETMLQAWPEDGAVDALPAIQLLGADGASKRLVAAHVATRLGVQLYRLPAGLLPTTAADLETLLRLWQRESLLLPIALYLDTQGSDRMPTPEVSRLNRFLERCHGLVFLDTRDHWAALERETIALDIAKPTSREQEVVWMDRLGPAAAQTAQKLASQFNLNLPTIMRAAQQAHRTVQNKHHLPTQLWDTCLVNTRPQLDILAQRLDAKATWDDLVLPAEGTQLLQQIAAQVRQRRRVYEDWGFSRRMNRGLGISALFAGESGTGKTMAAEVIANDLRLNLSRIDLSAVVSKYIGETEKNLRRVFDAAEDGGAILFFDEADALFGKRSEVKDSHDRYANIEINYLLQRMEAYRGLAILATNMKSALDKAFTRRLRFMITFPFPGATEREGIWQRVFPTETPTEGLDYQRLARFDLTGGSIHNIALNAAFLAAQAGTAVTMPLVLAATRTELCKLERPINQAAFRDRTRKGGRISPTVSPSLG